MVVFFCRRAAVLALLGAALGLSACSPTFNWRELRPEGAPLLALMPCKPETASRPVPLLGKPTELHMHSCEAGGLTFAVAWADVPEARQARAALAEWQTASLAAIRVAPGAAQPLVRTVAGASEVIGVQAQGSDHQGKALSTQSLYFAQGGKVYQAAIYGPKMTDAASTAFFEGLSLR